MPARQTTRELIEKATLKARNDWWRYSITQEKAIFDLLQESATRLNAKINAAYVGGKIPQRRLFGLLKNVKEEMQALRPRLSGQIKRSMSRSVDLGIMAPMEAANLTAPPGFKVGIGTSFFDDKGNIQRWNRSEQKYADSTWFKINADAMNALLRFKPQGLMFSQRVWNITFSAQRAITNEIQLAVLQGTSPANLSRTIRGFLQQPESLFRRVGKDGQLVLSRAANAFRPGQGVYRSAFKNAIRLARTEMARAYHEGTIRYGLARQDIKGFIWRTASGEPCPICSDLDGVYFPKDDVPAIPHPNCFCYLEIVYTSEQTPDRTAGDLKQDTKDDTWKAIQ